MKLSELNAALKRIANDMATLENKEKLTEEEQQAYKTLVAEGKKLRDQFDAQAEAQALKDWMHQPDGKSATGAIMRQEMTSPDDRDQEQRSQDAAAKSAYKSAYEAYLRFGFKRMGEGDQKILTQGAIKAIGDGNAANGDFTVPEDFQAQILKKTPGLIGLTDSVRSQPTSRDVLVWPKVTYTTDNKYTSPIRLTFTGKIPASATTIRVTDQTFGEARIPVNLAMASQLISNSLVEDSATDVMALTTQLFNENIQQDVEYYLANGTGAGQPEGLFVNSTAQTNHSIGGGAATITSASIQTIYWDLPAQYRAVAKWVMSSSTGKTVATFVDGNGRYLWSADNMFGGGLQNVLPDGVVQTTPGLLGRPVIFTEHAPTVTTNSYPIAFGNLQGYIRADRVGISVRVLEELYAETDQKLFLLRMRFGGQLAEDYKVRLLKVSTT